jgi:Na+-driven multidrug efflux pump
MATTTASPLLTAPIGPTIIRLAAPNMIAMVVTMVTLMAEAWYVGQLGTESLAGLALAFPMMMLVMMLSAGSFGGTITGTVARRLGAGDRAGAEVLALHAVLLAVLMAGACTLVFLPGGRWIYSLLGASPFDRILRWEAARQPVHSGPHRRTHHEPTHSTHRVAPSFADSSQRGTRSLAG